MMMVVIWLVMMMVVMIMMMVNDDHDDGNLYQHKSMNPPKLNEVHVTTGAKIEMTFTPWSNKSQVFEIHCKREYSNLDMVVGPE